MQISRYGGRHTQPTKHPGIPRFHSLRPLRLPLLALRVSNSGYSFEHRRDWIEQRMLELAAVFVSDGAACAVVSNHYHVTLHVDGERAHSCQHSDDVYVYRSRAGHIDITIKILYAFNTVRSS